ncbi:MAG TPA: hypothetical protein VEX18_12070 [Polyangiaceae bacterium]|nr:hypothetical protein [Polyangiaceae bacterium]
MFATALEPAWRDELELQEAEAQRHRAAQLFIGSARLELLSSDRYDDVLDDEERDGL